jgi:S1-C subfamily serine protease
MKHYFILLLMIFSLSYLSAENESGIFEKYESSTVYIYQSLFLNSKNVKDPRLIQSIEKKYNVKILDNHFTLSSGTGFLITKDGYTVTNHHVIEKGSDLESIKYKIFNSLMNDFFDKLPDEVLPDDSYGDLRDEVRELCLKADFSYRIFVNNKDDYPADLIQSDKDLDVALLKIKSDTFFNAVPMGDSDSLKVGYQVTAIGYPVPSSLFYAVKEFKSTMTSGVVSALRSDNWGIQHTSSISPGNSGGPLFNHAGEVIGVNVGAVTTGNNLFFSIPINKLKKWLEGINYGKLIAQNKEQAERLGKKFNLNSNGNLELGRSFFINLTKKYHVYINNKLQGVTPIFLENIPEGIHILKIESDSEFLEQKIEVRGDIGETVTLEPVLNKHSGSLFVSSQPAGASVIINGRKEGVTPCVINKVVIGSTKILIEKDGYFSREETIQIEKNKTLKKEYSLERGYKIVFKNKMPDKASVTVSGGDKIVDLVKDPATLFKKGKLEILIKSDFFKEKKISIDLNDDYVIDFNPEFYITKVKMNNLKPESRIFFNDTDVTDKIKDGTIDYSSGEYKIRVSLSPYQDHITEAKLESGKDFTIDVVYLEKQLSRSEIENKVMKSRVNAGIAGVSGGVFTVFSISMFIGSASLFNMSSSFNDMKTGAAVVGAFGGVFAGVALISFFVAAGNGYNYSKYKKLLNSNARTEFSINQEEVELAICIRL